MRSASSRPRKRRLGVLLRQVHPVIWTSMARGPWLRERSRSWNEGGPTCGFCSIGRLTVVQHLSRRKESNLSRRMDTLMQATRRPSSRGSRSRGCHSGSSPPCVCSEGAPRGARRNLRSAGQRLAAADAAHRHPAHEKVRCRDQGTTHTLTLLTMGSRTMLIRGAECHLLLSAGARARGPWSPP